MSVTDIVKRLAVLVGLTVCAQGCALSAKDPSVTLHADVHFTPAERQCIQDSRDVWQYQTNGLAYIETKYDLDGLSADSMRAHQRDDRLVRWTSTTPLLVAYETAEQVQIYGQVQGRFRQTPGLEMRLVADRLTDPHTCKLTAIHEFGHVLGLEHVSEPQSIMYPALLGERKECLKEEDLLVYCLRNSCGNIPMKPCPADEVFPELKVEDLKNAQ